MVCDKADTFSSLRFANLHDRTVRFVKRPTLQDPRSVAQFLESIPI